MLLLFSAVKNWRNGWRVFSSIIDLTSENV
jgi:hypothetical protein